LNVLRGQNRLVLGGSLHWIFQYRQRFETKNVIFKIERSPINKNKLMLTINQQPISEWFKEQWEKLQQHLRNSVQKEQKSKGFRM